VFATPNVVTTSDSARVLRLVGVGSATQVSFPGITKLYSGSSSTGAPRTFAAGHSSQALADSTGAGSFAFGVAGPGEWVGQTIALRAASDRRTLFRDRFSRVVPEGWGTATFGGPWFANVPGPNLNVDGSRGVAVIPNATVYNLVPREAHSYGLNVAGITSFSVDRAPDGGLGKFHTVQVYARRNDLLADGNNYYRYRVRILGSGVMDMRTEKNVNGVRTWLNAAPVRLPMIFTPGAKYWIRWEATGTSPATTVRMRVWEDGEPEPTSWPASVVIDEPALDLPGTTGYRFEVGTFQVAWPVTFTVDDLTYSEFLR
jgi:hypothetical protein